MLKFFNLKNIFKANIRNKSNIFVNKTKSIQNHFKIFFWLAAHFLLGLLPIESTIWVDARFYCSHSVRMTSRRTLPIGACCSDDGPSAHN